MRIKCAAVLFDLDGVLVDSTPAVARVWTKWALEHGFDPEQTVRKAHGRPSITTIRELLPDADDEAENKIVERMELNDLDGVAALRGALNLLNALPKQRWAVITSCTKPLALVRICAARLPTPKFLVTSDDIRHGKPDPEPYLKGAELLGVPAKDCLVMEDAPAGIRAGKAAGARVLAFRTTESDELLKAAGADWIAKDCSALSLDGIETRDRVVLNLVQD
jgi:mannitol-1-/sugar-/sorbitol-6-phosphatase